MRKAKKTFLMLLLVLVGAMSLSSCEEDNDDVVMPDVKFKYEGWLFVANGETLTLKSFSIDEAKSSEGVHISLVNYYLDGEKIASSTLSPFGLSYLIKDKSVGEHELKVYVEVSGEGYADMKYTINLTVYVLKEPFALDVDCYFDNNSVDGKPIVNNGQTFSGNVTLAESNTLDATITKVEYYWDDKLFGASSIKPFNFIYDVNNEKVGNHKFKYVATLDTDYGVISVTTITNVEVRK